MAGVELARSFGRAANADGSAGAVDPDFDMIFWGNVDGAKTALTK